MGFSSDARNRAVPTETNKGLNASCELKATSIEKAPVRNSPAPTVRIVPIAPNLVTTNDPTKIPTVITTPSVEYVWPPLAHSWLEALHDMRYASVTKAGQ